MLEPVPASETEVRANLAAIRSAIAHAADRSGRDPGSVTLVAAAKAVPAAAIRWAVEGGVTAVGENYLPELRDARAALEDLPVRWHYIGTLQSSTSHRVADLSDVVETLAGEHATRRLAARAARSGRLVDTLIEVDLAGTRSGVRPDALPAFAAMVSSLDGVRLRGLMTLPPPPTVAEDARRWFAQLRTLRDRLRDVWPDVLELSMGMSLDYEVAVEEGATMVRIGTGLFGPRTP
jgi:pyridoxal phosphate enzyme (YggS family)